MTRFVSMIIASALLSSCAVFQPAPEPIPAVDSVDLERFMGDWYVIGFIPIGGEQAAHNGIESYQLRDDGRISTIYRYREGGFDGPLKTHTPNARVEPNSGNARWGMQFLWPFRAEYVIADLDADYRNTIIARSKRDYVWLMSRTPEMSDELFASYREKIAALGYDTAKFLRQPQQWPETQPRPPLDWD